MNQALVKELIKKYNKDINYIISNNKLPAKALFVEQTDTDSSALLIKFLVDVLGTEHIVKVNVLIEDLDNLFYTDDYKTIDNSGNINANKYDSLTLARLRLLRIAFNVIKHIATGWTDTINGCYRKNSQLALGEKVYVDVRSPGILVYHH
jgi:hypothetical protein